METVKKQNIAKIPKISLKFFLSYFVVRPKNTQKKKAPAAPWRLLSAGFFPSENGWGKNRSIVRGAGLGIVAKGPVAGPP